MRIHYFERLLVECFAGSFMKICAVALACIGITVAEVHSAEFYVDANHPSKSDLNVGTATLPWSTMQRAGNTGPGGPAPGDIVYIKPGTYDERVTVNRSGQAGLPITYKAVGAVITRGFRVNGSFVRIIGFEITQTTPNNNPNGSGIDVAANECLLQDNNIHHTGWISIRAVGNKNIIRGNKCSFPRGIPGDQFGENAIQVNGHTNLVEYNEIWAVGDYSNVFGSDNIVRNNYFGPCADAFFPDHGSGTSGHHVDMLQWFFPGTPLIRTFFEANYGVSNLVNDGHGVLIQRTGADASRYFIMRGNVVARIGSAGYGSNPFNDAYLYHNSFIDNCMLTPANVAIGIGNRDGFFSENNHLLNNLLYAANRPTGIGYSFETTTDEAGRYTDYNMLFLSGSPTPLEAHGIVGSNPLLVNYSGGDYHLTSGSPARNAAGPITLANGSGSGTSLVVDNSNRFTDGYTIAGGDWIVVANSAPVRITSINYSTHRLTLSASISWNDNDPVYWATPSGALRDIGAFSYRPGGYQYGIAITSPSPGATVGGSVQIQANVTNPDCVRHVIFHVNGIPKATVEASPYSYTWVPPGSGSYTLEARAYAYFADTTLTRSAAVNVIVGTPPAAPQNLRIVPQ